MSEVISRNFTKVTRQCCLLFFLLASFSSFAQVDRFIGLSGNALTDEIANATISQISPVYRVRGRDAGRLFSQNNMSAIAKAIEDRATRYTGVDDEGIASLTYYLRASFYVQYQSPEDIGEYSSKLYGEIEDALKELFDQKAILEASYENAPVLRQAVILIDSADIGEHFNDFIIKLLNAYDDDWKEIRDMNRATNQAFNVVRSAIWNDELRALYEKDHTILDALYDFQERNRDLLNTRYDYVLINATREIPRLFHVPEMYERVKELSKSMLDTTNSQDETTPVWISVASIVNNYDSANCEFYDLCGFALKLELETLPFNYECSEGLIIRAQHMYNDQAKWICDVLSKQGEFFHASLQTGEQPVEDDFNEVLEIVIFDSSYDYKLYAGLLFNISTDNGGIFLEGQPNIEGNKARFIAYEAEWRRPVPEFSVWNLQHEYVHYLDGRYNKYGDFQRAIAFETTWWTEGLAEYISRKDANYRVIVMGESQRYDLATIFQNSYSSGNALVYRWSYLAVRFLFERHESDVATMLNYLRNNEFEDFEDHIFSISDRYDSEWREWLISGLPSNEVGIAVSSPAETDDKAKASGSEGNTVLDLGVSTDFSECNVQEKGFDPEYGRLKFNDSIECVNSQYGFVELSIPNKNRITGKLTISINGGWGDSNILYKAGDRPYGTDFDAAVSTPGNTDELTVEITPEHYWHYIALEGNFGGVTLTTTTSR